ncbi:protein FAM177A1 isoform X2 [Triplophysa dalaica]|uniref:protein FAM177A1 isoform X2 n=1 Tax=Triplophysa dalaica TaxID=1582913 RepID=UPI0024E0053A|nr:protein FAM177A1 isoform X2 [Triplophysa dalaica]
MDFEKSSVKDKEYECVELGDLGRKEKIPRRIIHFSSGETMEEYSTDDEEEDKKESTQKGLLSSTDTMWRAATSALSACDYLGERLASLLSITSAKYQYAIDEYSRSKGEEEGEEDTYLSEKAEHLFEEQPNEEDLKTNQPETKSTKTNVELTNELDLNTSLVPNRVLIPALVTST